MCFPFTTEQAEDFGRYFGETKLRIRVERFEITTPHEAAIRRECELWTLCRAQGIISGDARG